MKTMFLKFRQSYAKKAFAALVAVLFVGQVMAQTAELNEARRLIDNEQYEKAIAKLNTYLAANPKDEKAEYLMGKAYFQMEKYSEASAWFNKGMGHSARFPMNFVGAGAVEVKRDNFAGAKAKIDEAGGLNKDNDPVVLMAMAEAYMGYPGQDRKKLGQYLAEAEPLLYKVQKLAPNNAEAWVLLGDLYYLQGVEELAQSSYEGAIQRDPKLVVASLRLGILYKKQKKYNEAAEMFEKAIALDPNFAPALREMAEMWFMAKKYDKANEYMNKYLALMGNEKGARMRSCIFYYAGEQYDQAIQCIEALDTSSYVLTRLLAYSYVKRATPDPDKALSYFDKYYSVVPAAGILPTDYEFQGKAQQLKGNTAEAVALYEKAIALSAKGDDTTATRSDLYITIADMYKEQKDHLNRAAYIEKFLATEKTFNLKESFNLGIAYYTAQNFQRADSAFRIITEQKPDLHVGYLWRGKANVQMDEDSKQGLAKPYLEKVKEMIGTDEEKKAKYKDDYLFALRYLAAYHTLVANDCNTALPMWNEILQLKPDDEQANNGLKFCKQ